MKKNKILNIAIVGLGNIGSYLYKYLQTNKKTASRKRSAFRHRDNKKICWLQWQQTLLHQILKDLQF